MAQWSFLSWNKIGCTEMDDDISYCCVKTFLISLSKQVQDWHQVVRNGLKH